MTEQASLHEFAAEILADLQRMSVAPLPECYEIWFLHKQKQNPYLSQEIEDRISRNLDITTDFLSSLYYKYCGVDHVRAAFDRHYEGVLVEVEGLQGVAKGLSDNASAFGSNIRTISKDVQGVTLGQSELKHFINLLVETAANAARRNSELEEELNAAAKKIGALKESIREIENDAYTDFLTKLCNRRAFDKAIREAIATAEKEGASLSLVVCDVDHFKNFNDSWGHHIGDQVLKYVASVLKKNTNGQDIVARYGGEEFAIALPNTGLANATNLAEHIRAAICRRRLVSKTTNEDLGVITMSFGVAEHRPGGTAERLFRDADSALYEAKKSGRNKVAAFDLSLRRIA